MIEEESGSRELQFSPPPDASRQASPAGGPEEFAAASPPARGPEDTRPEVRAGAADSRGTTTGPKPAPERSTFAPVENTQLERRVLAHERILQALIAHMAESEPRFLDRLSETFCVPQERSRAEHDYTDTDSYAAEFIGTVVRLGKDAARKRSAAAAVFKLQTGALATDASDTASLFRLPPIEVYQSSGIWRVTRDGEFYGDFHEEQAALEAAEVAGRGVGLPA